MRGRPVGELVVLAFVGTICMGVLAFTLMLTIIAVWQPDRDISRAFATVSATYSNVLALLAGYLTGRARTNGRSNGSSGGGNGGELGGGRRHHESIPPGDVDRRP